MKKSINPYIVLLLMLFTMMATALSLHKVAPILSLLSAELGITDGSRAGLLISIFVISGIFLTIPIGLAVERVGFYRMGLAALLFALTGSLIGWRAGSYGVLLLSRVIEGLGLIVATTMGPILVTRLFSGKKLASAMGILMSFMPCGQTLSFLLVPRIESAWSWRAVWEFTAAVFLVLLILWLWLMRSVDRDAAPAAGADGEEPGFRKAAASLLTSRKLLLVCGVILAYLLVQQGTSGFVASYLSDVRGLSATRASAMTSAAYIAGIPAGVFAGWFSDRVRSRKWPIAIFMILSGVSYPLMAVCPTALFTMLAAYWGFTANGIMGLCFSAGSEAVDPSLAPKATAVMNTVQWIGVFFAATVFGALKDGVGWNAAFRVMLPIAVLGALLAVLLPGKKEL